MDKHVVNFLIFWPSSSAPLGICSSGFQIICLCSGLPESTVWVWWQGCCCSTFNSRLIDKLVAFFYRFSVRVVTHQCWITCRMLHHYNRLELANCVGGILHLDKLYPKNSLGMFCIFCVTLSQIFVKKEQSFVKNEINLKWDW